MGIPTRLYNKVFNIYRVTDVTPSSSFAAIGAEKYVLASIGISGRIASWIPNETAREGVQKYFGQNSGFKYKFFCATTTDIKPGDRMIRSGVSTERYIVDFVNNNAGGLSDHHLECDVTSTNFMQES